VIRNIIFDWSGTLVDDLSAVWQASNYVFRRAGVDEMTLDQFRAEFCLPFKDFYSRYVPHVTLSQLEEWFHGHYRQLQTTVVELPHARDFLSYCRRKGLRTFLLSTVHRDHFATQSAITGFDRFIDEPYVEVWDKRAKILEVLERHQLRAEETLFVGDMQHDIETAHHGGIVSCAVLTGYNRLDQLRASKPHLIVEHLGELRQILEREDFELGSQRLLDASETMKRPTVTVGSLIYDSSGRVLMIRTQKWSNLWGIPGGKIKYGEESVDALRREIKEETNLDIDDIRFVLVQDCVGSKEFYRDAHFVLLNYTCCRSGVEEVKLNDEAQDFKWVSIAEALRMELNLPTRKLLEAVKKD
jgi:phosphoglycolate phosphatase-like HAD superfamily hydrolase/ADP-ribose pyrophosphatase YjhB (NUDIX family)